MIQKANQTVTNEFEEVMDVEEKLSIDRKKRLPCFDVRVLQILEMETNTCQLALFHGRLRQLTNLRTRVR
jgi:hypothetical protein